MGEINNSASYPKGGIMNTFFSLYNFFAISFIARSNDLDEFVKQLRGWIFLVFPPTWPFVLAIYFVIYFIILYIAITHLEIYNPSKVLMESVFKASFFGIFCDMLIIIYFLGYVVLARVMYSKEIEPFFEKWMGPLYVAILGGLINNVFVILIICFLIFLTRLLNYKLNESFIFKKLDIDEEKKKKLALYLIPVTSIYVFFVPVGWFFKLIDFFRNTFM